MLVEPKVERRKKLKKRFRELARAPEHGPVRDKPLRRESEYFRLFFFRAGQNSKDYAEAPHNWNVPVQRDLLSYGYFICAADQFLVSGKYALNTDNLGKAGLAFRNAGRALEGALTNLNETGSSSETMTLICQKLRPYTSMKIEPDRITPPQLAHLAQITHDNATACYKEITRRENWKKCGKKVLSYVIGG